MSAFPTDIIRSIGTTSGISIINITSVHGGDINQCFCVADNANKYFLKINNAERYPLMFEKEAKGLEALKKSFSLIVAKVIRYGISGQYQYLLLEWLDKDPIQKNSMYNFGAALAQMHKTPQPLFGWQEDNFIGSLQQSNIQLEDWNSFYAQCRIIPMAQKLFADKVFDKKDLADTVSLCKNINNIFPKEPASLLHGDLWGGNYMITSGGKAAIFDPAVYYGHREMDIGMTRLFGGFDTSFYTGYNDVYPLEKEWEKRISLTQLYPLLVHAVLFGGHYIYSAKEIIRKFT